jgi:hypothetical protein
MLYGTTASISSCTVAASIAIANRYGWMEEETRGEPQSERPNTGIDVDIQALTPAPEIEIEIQTKQEIFT